MKKILAVIPARKNSKGIPQKNKVVINEVPLIFHTILNAKNVNQIDDVVVTTDDDEVISFAKYLGVDFIKREPELCKDSVPLAPVLKNAVEITEEKNKIKYDIVILMQATSPTLKKETLAVAISDFQDDKENDTYISGLKHQHLFWMEKDGKLELFQKERINRQFLKPIFFETGAFFIIDRRNLKEESFLGKKIKIIETQKEESIDVDDRLDISIVQAVLSRKKILFTVIGSKTTGLGHIFRVLTLARWLSKHEMIFVTTLENDLAIKIFKENNYEIEILDNWDNLKSIFIKYQPEIIINDVLDTKSNFMTVFDEFRADTPLKIVNFEDLGVGSKIANIVVNALYETTITLPNHYYGYKYVCLKDSFRYLPFKEIANISNILITLGGTDPNSLTEKIIPLLTTIPEIKSNQIKITVINGPGFSLAKIDEISKIVNQAQRENININIRTSIKDMAYEMSNNDLVISSNGRSVYEAVSLGIPVISFAQNEREESHLFSKFAPCVYYMGRYMEEKISYYKETIQNLIRNEKLAKEKNIEAISFGKEIREGLLRIIKLIESD